MDRGDTIVVCLLVLFLGLAPGMSVTCGDGVCEPGEECPQDATDCPDTTCYDPTCTSGCGEEPVTQYGTDEGCTAAGDGCSEGECACDGFGSCAAVNGYDCSFPSGCASGICCFEVCQAGPCEGYCGDGICDHSNESEFSCPQDCQAECGDNHCSFGEEFDCPQDCQECNNNGECNPGESITYCADCSCDDDGLCETPSENEIICPYDCAGACNSNGWCELDETTASCSSDCECIDDGTCGPTENQDSCPEYCGCTVDGSCSPNESPISCPLDCDECGDGYCMSSSSENCPADAASCPTGMCEVATCDAGCETSFVPAGESTWECSLPSACDGAGHCDKALCQGPCTTDEDCALGVCCSGVCRTQCEAGCGDCTCDPGEYCAADDAGCPDSTCETGVCGDGCESVLLPLGATDQWCTSSGGGCNEDGCACNGEGYCETADGYQCAEDWECASNNCCDGYCQAGPCGGGCFDDNDCTGGDICCEGMCQLPPCGGGCFDDNDCTGGDVCCYGMCQFPPCGGGCTPPCTGENLCCDGSCCPDHICYEPTCGLGCGENLVAQHDIDETCYGSMACDGAGTCKNANGYGCSADGDCASGTCCAGTCEDSCAVCGNWFCETGEGEDHVTCPQDCCDADGTATYDDTCHTECGADTTCDGSGYFAQDCAGVEGYCNQCTYTACPGCSDCSGGTCSIDDQGECAGTEGSCECMSGSCTTCAGGEYCLFGCTTCSGVCDGSCAGSACYGYDPDCDAFGGATNTCCGNGACDGAETANSCPGDCCDPSGDGTGTPGDICYSSCGSHAACDALELGAVVCSDTSNWATCCMGSITSCGGGNTCVAQGACCGDDACDEARGESQGNCPEDCYVGKTIDQSPENTYGTHLEAPVGAEFTVVLRVRNTGTVNLDDVEVRLTYWPGTLDYLDRKTYPGDDWLTDGSNIVMLGSIPPGGEATAVFKLKALSAAADQQLNLYVESTTPGFGNQAEYFHVDIVDAPDGGDSRRFPIAVNTMWEGRSVASLKYDFPDTVEEPTIAVWDSDISNRLFTQVFDRDPAVLDLRARVVWQLNPDGSTLAPRQERFYWVRFAEEGHVETERSYGLAWIKTYTCNYKIYESAETACPPQEGEDNYPCWGPSYWEGETDIHWSFIPDAQEQAQEFGSKLTAASWGKDFEDSEGGVDDTTFLGKMPSADMFMYVGHGYTATLPASEGPHFLAYQRNDPDIFLYSEEFTCGSPENRELDPDEAVSKWGTKDTEWVALLACASLVDEKDKGDYDLEIPRLKQEWAKAMNGLHLILGFTDSHKDSSLHGDGWAFGDKFGEYMKTADPDDPSVYLTIKDSWFRACNDEIYPLSGTPETNPAVARVVAEEMDNLEDHLWGYGYVSSDPVPDDRVIVVDHECKPQP